ncbi:MAG: DNA adenine methylase [Phycisphaerae bacterium]|nr:DNA adenine methylase [Phycisphaerae bacterium]
MTRRNIYAPLLRAPGAKTRFGAKCVSLMPADTLEFREPFCFSAAVYARVPPTIRRWISDVNPAYADFYRWVATDPSAPALIETVRRFATTDERQRIVYFSAYFGQAERGYPLPLETLILTRHGYCGIIRRKPNHSPAAHKNGMRVVSPERVAYWRAILPGTRITCADYEEVVLAPGRNVTIYLDPPYLLGARRDHGQPVYPGFDWGWRDYLRLAEVLRRCPHRWIMTVDQSVQMYDLFRNVSGARFLRRDYTGSVNTPNPKHEWVITNYNPRTVARLQPVTREQAYGLATSVSTIGATE